MKKITTKKELFNWIKEAQAFGNSVPCVINGGGFFWLRPEDDFYDPTDDENYEDKLEYLERGNEYEDFRCFLEPKIYEDMTFVRLKHNNSYNQENCDMQIGIYEI